MLESASFHVTLQQLRHFVVLAETLHFGKAADVLNIAQPALSRSIQQLEHGLGLRLFERTNRRVSLSEPGRAFLAGTEETLAALERCVRHTRQVEDGTCGTLRIGYTDFAINGRLPSILRAFSQRYPEITIEPVHEVTVSQLAQLDSGALDLGFLTGPIERDDVETIAIQEDPFVVILYRAHRLCESSRIRLGDLADERFVLGTPGYWEHFMGHLLRLCEEGGFTPTIVQHAYNTEGIFGLVACEMGITISTTAARNFQREELVVRPLADSPGHRDMRIYSVILDANVLYSQLVRDVLRRLGQTDSFKARWTDDIHSEWILELYRSLV